MGEGLRSGGFGVVDRAWSVRADILGDPTERASSNHVPLYVMLKVEKITTEYNKSV